MAEQTNKSSKSSPNSYLPKRPRSTNQLGRLLIAAGLAGLVTALLIGQSRQTVELTYSQLVQLIENSDKTDGSSPGIVITEKKGGQLLRVRYWNVQDLTIGPQQVTGKVSRQVLGNDSEEPQHEVPFRTSRWGLENDNNYLFQLAKQHGIEVRAEEPPGSLEYFASFFLPLIVLALIFIWLARRFGGPGSAMAFGRSRGRMFMQEDIGITFADVAGIDEAVEEVKEIVEFLKNPEKFRALGGRIPRGVLLVGPPGTGKTLLAKAIAGEAGVPFFSLSGSDFVEMFVGVGAARVRDMFRQAQNNAPCIIFIDELDALGKARGSTLLTSHDEREQTLNALLVEMDGFSSSSGVIVLGATNRPETLDPALLRPGRFDRHILVDRPDLNGREAILKVHTRDVKLDDSVDLRKIAALTPGFVGADLANLVNEAALLAARKGKTAVTMEEFNEAVERVTAGLEKRQRLISPEEKQRIAYHEAAHALVAHSLPEADPVHKVSIIPRGIAALGYTLQRPEGDRYLLTQRQLEARIQVLLAGIVAEQLVFDDVSTGAQNDLEQATEIARSMVMELGMSRLGRICFRRRSNNLLGTPNELVGEKPFSEQTAREIDEEIKRIISNAQDRVMRILTEYRTALDTVASRLMEKEVIDTDELKEIIEATCPTPKIAPGTVVDTSCPDTRATSLTEQTTPPDSQEGKSVKSG